jgi:hypothetical protein
MNYFVKRGSEEFGPYTLALLQQYVSQGSISPQDLARSEGMTEWMPVSTIVGNVVATPANTYGNSTSTAYSNNDPLPPNMHWAVLVLLSLVTFSIFWYIWLFVQASWVKKVRPQSRATLYLIGWVATIILRVMFARNDFSILFGLGSIVFSLSAIFSMRSDIEEYYSTVNPIGLSLSGVMTFFFSAAYFQYHFREIREVSENQRARAATV